MTIIELMIVLIIIAILVALAYPSYVDYVRKARRGEAHQLLLNWSINQEIFRSNHPEYAPIGSGPGQLPEPKHDNYTFPLPVRSATAYTLTATAKGDQVNDKTKAGANCSPMTLTQTGAKSPADCWN